MMDIEQLLKLSYDMLKVYIINEEPFMLEALKDTRIKDKLINCDNKYDLIWLVQDMSNEYGLSLFDEEGIRLLSETKDVDNKMNGILTCCKDYVSELFKNENFCSLVLEKFDRYDSYFTSLNKTGALSFIKFLEKEDPGKIKKLLPRLSKTTQLEVVKEIEIPSEIINFCLVNLAKDASCYVINNDYRITSLNNLHFSQLFSVFSHGYTINPILLEDQELIRKIVTMSSVKDYRFLLNELIKANDTDHIESLRKDYYEKELLSYDKDFNMLERHKNCYLELLKLMESDMDYDEINNIIDKYFNLFGTDTNNWNLRQSIWAYLGKKDKEGLKDFLINESKIEMTNMIVDYHFEDVPYNFFLDITQLIRFQENEGRTLTDEDLSIYKRLLHLDTLTYEEKISLHQELSKEDWISKHYDIFRAAKDKASRLILEQMLNPNNVGEFLDKEETVKHGVPIYVLEGQEFFAFIKSLCISKETILDESELRFYVDGSSYSLDGSRKLNTFNDPREYYNLIYGEFPVDQVIHMYPVDSYSKYDRTFATKATPRVYELYTPTEFVEKSSDYNEIVLAQYNKRREGDDLNDGLKVPTILGIYCYDEITPNDIESAKKLGVGIVVVKTKNYDLNREDRLSMMETISPTFGMRYAQKIDYLSNVTDDDLIHRRPK